MSQSYYLNEDTSQNPNNDHEVHTSDCIWFPSLSNRTYLGVFNNCFDAMVKAKTHYSNVDGCKTCCSECNHD